MITNKIALIYCLITPVLIFTLQACRNSTTPNHPQSTPTIKPSPTFTPVVSEQIILDNYTHTDNRFSIDYPAHWKFFERPDGIIFIEPNDQAGYSVVFTDVGRPYNEQELNQYLVTFVAQNFAGAGSNFKAISQEQNADGTVTAQFSSIDPNFGHSLGQAISQVQVLQQDTLVFVIHLSATEEHWEDLSNTLQSLADSFVPLDTSPIATPEATAEPPDWVLIGPESKEFGFLYANDWQILESEQNLISVRAPDAAMTFTASKFVWPQTRLDSQAAEKAALAHLETLAAEYKDVQNLPPTEFPLHTATGTTIDFVYTTDDDVIMAGSIITAVYDGKMYKIVFTAPADFYEASLQWFNPMYKSFKFLEPEEFVEEEEK